MENIVELMDELHQFWQSDDVDLKELVDWVCERFDVQMDITFTYDKLIHNVKYKILELDKLNRLCIEHNVYVTHSETKEKRNRIARAP